MKYHKLLIIAYCCIVLLSILKLDAQSDSGQGRHKQIYAVPVPVSADSKQARKIIIDGDLNDWDLSGQIEMFVIEPTRSTQSAKFALMYDKDAIYLSADVNDLTPMMNRHNPQTNAKNAWNADSCQFRLTTDPKADYPINENVFKYRGLKAKKDTRRDIIHLTLWNYTDLNKTSLQIATGMTYRCPRKSWAPYGLVPQNLFDGKYLKRKNGTGYTFEYRIPWSTLGVVKPLKGGDIVAGTVQFNWSRPDGLSTAGYSAWAYDVLRSPGFAYQSTRCWGKIIFSKTGNLSKELVNKGIPTERPLPLKFSYTLPEDSECTIQMFNRKGENVRILVPQQLRSGGKNIESWDGLDDWGNLLPAGDYTWRGIYHAPIKAKYRFSVHNSGKPPYPTDSNKGGWGADHGTPQTVCPFSNGMLLAWDSSEYGWGIIRTDLNGNKLWGSNYGATYLATDGKIIYVAGGHGFQASPNIQLLKLKNAQPTHLSNGIANITAPSGGNAADNTVTGLAYSKEKLYVSYGRRDLIGVFSTKDGKLIKTIEVNTPGRLAVRSDETLLVISNNRIVNIVDGKTVLFTKAHIDNPTGISIFKDGTVYVANRGKLQNVSVFSKDGRYIRSIGRQGGRPPIGKYDSSGIYEAGGIGLDSKGRLWVAETTDGPKRISVWNTKTGNNLMEFFGGSSYFAYGFIDSAKPNEIYCHNVLWDIDWKTYKIHPRTTVWRQTAPNMIPPIGPSAYICAPKIVTAQNKHQYMWGNNRRMGIIMRRDGDIFKPCTAILMVDSRNTRRSEPTAIDLVDSNEKKYPKGSYLWQDKNNDQTVQIEELTLIPGIAPYPGIAWLNKDLSILLKNGQILRPVSIKKNGQPIYDLKKIEKTFFVNKSYDSGYLLKDKDGSIFTLGRGRLTKWDRNGTEKWSYNNIPSWPKSLNLPIAKAGRLHGMTGAMGIAGEYFAHQTYFGINHVFRKDGVYVGALLKDGRTGGRGPYEGQPEGQNGSFVKLNLHGKERYFVIHGGQDCRVWEVLNLDTIKDLPGGVYHHTQAMFTKAKNAQKKYQAALKNVEELVIHHGRNALETAELLQRRLEDGRGFNVCMAYDTDKLYFKFEIITLNKLVNNINDPKIIFRGGNLFDIQLGTNPKADSNRKKPVPGDLRLLVTRKHNQPFAVLFCPKIKNFRGVPIVLKSPSGKESFDDIKVLKNIDLTYNKTDKGFTAVISVPLSELGLELKPGEKVKIDIGYIFGNKKGTRASVRAYLNNNTFTANVVNDIPHESRLEPAEWREAIVE